MGANLWMDFSLQLQKKKQFQIFMGFREMQARNIQNLFYLAIMPNPDQTAPLDLSGCFSVLNQY